MIYTSTIVNVSDNSGISHVKCFKISKQAFGSLGSLTYATITLRKSKVKLQKLNVVRGVIIRVKKNVSRKIGLHIIFSSNDVVLLNEKNEPLGTRIFGPLPLELRRKNCLKFLSLGSTFI